jgi:formate dehydrogenase subunit gamma
LKRDHPVKAMPLKKLLLLLPMLLLTLANAPAPAAAQDASAADRSATGGAQTLDDIMARQNKLKLDDSFRSENLGNPEAAKATTEQLGTLGGVSDSDFWRALRYDKAEVSTSSRSPASDVLVQDGGMAWLQFRDGPLRTYGGWLLLGMFGVLALFYALRGKIRIDGEKTGKTITRFSAIERFGHWLLAGSFVVLGITGLALLFGRVAIIPLIGHEAYAPVIIAGKWAHNNLSWAFMLGLALVTVFWIAHNIPNKHDLKWLAVGGGLFSKGVHPPARKFNAGQKLIFWSVVVLGISISVSGISLLFPFEFHLFGPTFAKLNALGLPQALGFGELATDLGPHAEMQLSQLWHAIISFVFMAIIIGHIYIGSVGMEGAFDAMGSGEVEVQWAKEHHGLWYEEVTGEKAHGPHDATPAE